MVLVTVAVAGAKSVRKDGRTFSVALRTASLHLQAADRVFHGGTLTFPHWTSSTITSSRFPMALYPLRPTWGPVEKKKLDKALIMGISKLR